MAHVALATCEFNKPTLSCLMRPQSCPVQLGYMYKAMAVGFSCPWPLLAEDSSCFSLWGPEPGKLLRAEAGKGSWHWDWGNSWFCEFEACVHPCFMTFNVIFWVLKVLGFCVWGFLVLGFFSQLLVIEDWGVCTEGEKVSLAKLSEGGNTVALNKALPTVLGSHVKGFFLRGNHKHNLQWLILL